MSQMTVRKQLCLWIKIYYYAKLLHWNSFYHYSYVWYTTWLLCYALLYLTGGCTYNSLLRLIHYICRRYSLWELLMNIWQLCWMSSLECSFTKWLHERKTSHPLLLLVHSVICDKRCIIFSHSFNTKERWGLEDPEAVVEAHEEEPWWEDLQVVA